MQDGKESTEQVATRFPHDDLVWARARAEELDRPLAYVLRAALSEYRENHPDLRGAPNGR